MTSTTPIGERVAVVETKIDQLSERIAHHERHVNSKLDAILEGQTEGRTDRAELRVKITGIETAVSNMKPEIETVATAKNVWKAILILSTIAGSIAGAVAVGWSYVKPHIVWFFHTKG